MRERTDDTRGRVNPGAHGTQVWFDTYVFSGQIIGIHSVLPNDGLSPARRSVPGGHATQTPPTTCSSDAQAVGDTHVAQTFPDVEFAVIVFQVETFVETVQLAVVEVLSDPNVQGTPSTSMAPTAVLHWLKDTLKVDNIVLEFATTLTPMHVATVLTAARQVPQSSKRVSWVPATADCNLTS